MQPENRLFWIDNLKSIATIGVIFIHVSGAIFYQSEKVSNYTWWIGNIYDGIARFSVPLFAMITGATLLSDNYLYPDFFRKRFLRIIPPLLIWGSVYIVFNLAIKYFHGEYFAFNQVPNEVWMQIKNGIVFHFWYIYMIIGIYVLIPLIRSFINFLSENGVLSFLVIWFFILLIKLPFISALIPDNKFTYFACFLGYPVLGYYLSTKSFDNYWKINWIAILFIVSGILITVTGTYYLSLKQGVFTEDFYGYLTPNVLLVATGIFILFKQHPVGNKKIIITREFISRYSYGIYLIHILVLAFLGKFGIKWSFIDPAIGIFITSVLCLIFSGAIIYLVNKLPFGKYVSG